MDEEKNLRSLAAEAEYRQKQTQSLQNQFQSIQNMEIEIEKTRDALKSIKEKNTALFNLGSGAFISTFLKDVDRLLVNIGSNIFVEKDIKSTLTFLEEKEEELKNAKNDLIKEMEAITTRLRDIDVEAKGVLKRMKKKEE